MSERNQQDQEIESFAQRNESRNAELAAQVAKIQQQISNGATKEVEELRGVLRVAREKLVEQGTLLKRLTTPPIRFRDGRAGRRRIRSAR